jgi:dienelactone hydrolase
LCCYAVTGVQPAATRVARLLLVLTAVLACASWIGAEPESMLPGGPDAGSDAVASQARVELSRPIEEPGATTLGSTAARPVLVWQDRFPSGKDKVAAEIFQPAGRGSFPVVVLLHGAGPRKAEKHYQHLAQNLAENGYLAVYVHYYDRGRRGRGSRSQWGLAVSDALTFASRLESADSQRIAVVGYSLGAFLALNRAPQDARVRAVVAYYGGISHGDAPENARAMPPTLLFHGTADRVVPVRRSLETVAALRKEGRPVDLVVYPGARHGFCLNSREGVDGRAADDSWARTLTFLDYQLRGPAERQVVEEDAPGLGFSPLCPARDTGVDEPGYLRTGAAGATERLAMVNPNADDVLSLVPRRPVRAKTHGSTRHRTAASRSVGPRVASVAK